MEENQRPGSHLAMPPIELQSNSLVLSPSPTWLLKSRLTKMCQNECATEGKSSGKKGQDG